MYESTQLHRTSPESYVWTTQFNDLRPGMPSSPDDRERLARRELIFASLFQNRIVIRDSDLVNHLELQRLIADDESGISRVIQTGAISFALRDHATDFTQVNEEAGRLRAFPERYEQSADLLKRVEPVLRRMGTVIRIEDDLPSRDRFRSNLDRLLVGRVLRPKDRDALSAAVETAIRRFDDSPLRFSEVYRELVQGGGYELESDLVQWCRTAHVMTAPQALSLAPAAVDLDLAPERVALLLDLNRHQGPGELDWGGEVPRRVLPLKVLDLMTFSEVAELRRIGVANGYYAALDAVRAAEAGKDTLEQFVLYVEALDRFLVEIGEQSEIELVDWQRAVLEGEIEKRGNRVKWFLPVAVGGGVIVTLLPHWGAGAVAPGLLASWLTGSMETLSGPIEQQWNRRLRSVLRGNTTYSIPR